MQRAKWCPSLNVLGGVVKSRIIASVIALSGATLPVFAYAAAGAPDARTQPAADSSSTITQSSRGTAQDASPASTSAQLQTIVVTAEKRTENVQTVPIALDVVQGNQLAAQGALTADDVVKMFPNINVQGASGLNDGVTIRGVGTSNLHLTAQESVGQYFDQVSAPSPFTSQLGLFDLQRVEVLRGPQNTLFGRNTTGGAINYISQAPSLTAGTNGYANVTGGNYGEFNFEGAVGARLSDTVAVRAAVMTQHRNGIFTALNNGVKYDSISRQAGRVSLLWKPSDATSILVSAHVAASTGAPPPLKGIGPTLADGITPCPATYIGTNGYTSPNNCYQQAKTKVLTNLSTPSWTDVYGVAPPLGAVHDAGGFVDFTHEFAGGAKVTAITGVDRTTVLYANDLVGAPFLQFEGDQDGTYDMVSQELRITSSSRQRFRWLGGLYYSYEYDDLGTQIINNTVNPPTSPPLVQATELKQTDRLASAYLRGDYDITKRLTASVGGRVTSDERGGTMTPRVFSFTQNGTASAPELPLNTFVGIPLAQTLTTGVATHCAVGVKLCSGPGLDQKQDTGLPGWNFSLKYRFNENVMAYLTEARGFKEGSFDVRAQAVFLGTALTPVKPEKLDAYETGMKSTLLDDHLRVNADVFHYEWHDLQAFSSTQAGGPALLNVPLSLIDGAELDTALRLGGGWSITASGGYLDGRIKNSGGLAGVVSGAPLSNVPKYTADGSIAKEFEIGSSGALQLKASGRYTGSMNSSLNGDPREVVSSVAFLDLSGQYTFGSGGQYRVSALAQNVTSAKTCSSNAFLLQGGTQGVYRCFPNEGVPLYSITFGTSF